MIIKFTKDFAKTIAPISATQDEIQEKINDLLFRDDLKAIFYKDIVLFKTEERIVIAENPWVASIQN